MNLKRVFAGVAAAATMLGGLTLGATTANAADGDIVPNSGKITLNGNTTGTDRTFNAYLLASYANPKGADGNLSSVDLIDNTAVWTAPTLAEAAETAEITSPTTNTVMSAVTNTATAAQRREFAKALADGTLPSGTSGTITKNEVSFSGLTPGYYLVVDNQGSPILIGSTVTVEPNTEYTNLYGKDLGKANLKSTNAKDNVQKVVKNAFESGEPDGSTTVSTGETLQYTVTSNVPNTTGYDTYPFAVKDTADADLTIDTNSITVSVGGEKLDTNLYTVKESNTADGKNETIITIKNVADYAFDAPIKVTYNATVTKGSTNAPFNNTAQVALNGGEYGAFANTTATTATLSFTKVNQNGDALADAEFTLSSDNLKNTNNRTASSNAEGDVTFSGLADDTYTIKETTAPNGYMQSTAPTFTVTIKGGKVTDVKTTGTDYGLVTNSNGAITVKNVQNVTQLPLTGAAGITMLVVVALLLGGAGALIAVRSRSLKRQLNA